MSTKRDDVLIPEVTQEQDEHRAFMPLWMRCGSAAAISALALFKIGGVSFDIPNPFGHGLPTFDPGFSGAHLFDGFGLHVSGIPAALADGASAHQAHANSSSGHAAGADGCAFGNHRVNGQSGTAPGCSRAASARAATTVSPAPTTASVSAASTAATATSPASVTTSTPTTTSASAATTAATAGVTATTAAGTTAATATSPASTTSTSAS